MESKPCLYLEDLPADAVKGLTVGQEVRVVLVGRVKAVGQRERHDYDEKGERSEKSRTVSHMDLEYDKSHLKVKASNQDVEDLIDDGD